MSSRVPPSGSQRERAVACVLAAIVLVVLDAAIVNVALPAIADSLHVTPAESVRVITAYQLALVMALLPSAALGESLGYRRVYTTGVAIFVGASALCAWAPSLPLLVAARFVQGLGGAAVLSLGVALLRFVVRDEQLGTVIGWNALAVALSSAAGPTLGALVLSSAEWPWLFAINLPLGALVLFATRSLPCVDGSMRRIDLHAVGLHATAFAAIVVGTELARERPALAGTVLTLGAVALIALVRRELPRRAPLIPLDLLRAPSFRLSVVASVCCFVGQSAAMVSLPFYLRHGLGQDALRTGLLITPWPLAVALVAPLAGRLAQRVPGATLCALGGAFLSLGLASAALLPLEGRPFALVPLLVLCGVGFGLFQVPNNRTMYLSAPLERSGAAGGMQGTARLTGQALGSLTMTWLFATTSIELAPRFGLGIAAVMAFLAGLVSWGRLGRKNALLGVLVSP